MFRICFAVFLSLSGVQSAFADAIPPPAQLSAMQKQLIGVWQEEKMTASRWATGHVQVLRTLIIGNDTLIYGALRGIQPSNEFGTKALLGRWAAVRADPKTVILTLDQGSGRGTVFTLVFEGDDAFTMTDKEDPVVPPGRFKRAVPTPVRGQ